MNGHWVMRGMNTRLTFTETVKECMDPHYLEVIMNDLQILEAQERLYLMTCIMFMMMIDILNHFKMLMNTVMWLLNYHIYQD